MRRSDRTVTGTIRTCLDGSVPPHVGPRGPARMASHRAELARFVAESARLEIPRMGEDAELCEALCEALSFALCERPGRLRLARCESLSYRKVTWLTQVDRDGEPWLILKAFAEQELGHQSLRALREVEGMRALARIPGVRAPRLVDVFTVHGEALPRHTILVAESFVPGRTLLGRLSDLAPGQPHAPSVRELFRRSGALLGRIHGATEAAGAPAPDALLVEARGFAEGLAACGVLGAGLAARAMAGLEALAPSLREAASVLAHRDFTAGNLLVDEHDTVAVVDIEKSDRELAAKDLAKFLETLHVDAALLGLPGAAVTSFQRAFWEGYEAGRTSPPSLRSQSAFYQLYTALALLRYHGSRGLPEAIGLLVARVEALARDASP